MRIFKKQQKVSVSRPQTMAKDPILVISGKEKETVGRLTHTSGFLGGRHGTMTMPPFRKNIMDLLIWQPLQPSIPPSWHEHQS